MSGGRLQFNLREPTNKYNLYIQKRRIKMRDKKALQWHCTRLPTGWTAQQEGNRLLPDFK